MILQPKIMCLKAWSHIIRKAKVASFGFKRFQICDSDFWKRRRRRRVTDVFAMVFLQKHSYLSKTKTLVQTACDAIRTTCEM